LLDFGYCANVDKHGDPKNWNSPGKGGYYRTTRRTLAVVDLTTTSGEHNALGVAMAEMLVVKLERKGKFRVVERSQIDKVLGELKLNLGDIFDVASAKKFGKALGADAIVTGSLTDLETIVDVNVRMIGVETGEIITSANAKMIKNANITKKLGEIIEKPIVQKKEKTGWKVPGKAPNRASKPKTSAPGGIFFQEDFSSYEAGDHVDPKFSRWGEAVSVFEADDKKWLGSYSAGEKTIAPNVQFPENWAFEFEKNVIFGVKEIAFIDDSGKELKISGVGDREYKFPDTDTGFASNHYKIKITKRGGLYKLYTDGKILLSMYDDSYSRFVGFKIVAKLDQGEYMLTNFVGHYLGE